MRRTNANSSSSGPNWFTGVTKTKTCAVSWCLQLHYTNMKYLPTSWAIYCKMQHVRTAQETLQWKVNLFISILPYKFAFSLDRGTIITSENIFNVSLSSVSWAYSMNEILILFGEHKTAWRLFMSAIFWKARTMMLHITPPLLPSNQTKAAANLLRQAQDFKL